MFNQTFNVANIKWEKTKTVEKQTERNNAQSPMSEFYPVRILKKTWLTRSAECIAHVQNHYRAPTFFKNVQNLSTFICVSTSSLKYRHLWKSFSINVRLSPYHQKRCAILMHTVFPTKILTFSSNTKPYVKILSSCNSEGFLKT